jgi:hypothetical protein
VMFCEHLKALNAKANPRWRFHNLMQRVGKQPIESIRINSNRRAPGGKGPDQRNARCLGDFSSAHSPSSRLCFKQLQTLTAYLPKSQYGLP